MIWVNINDLLPKREGIFKVRLKNGDEIKAFFHPVKGVFRCYKTKAEIVDLTHWEYR